MKPAVLLCDADLIKDVLCKDFMYFKRNDVNVSKKYDPLLSRNPSVNFGKVWKESRKTILPAFTSNKVGI